MTHPDYTMSDLELHTKHYWLTMQLSLRHFRNDVRDRDRDPYAFDELDLLASMTDSPRIKRLCKHASFLGARYAA